MHFLHPIWFAALSALTIPVLIHLWNVKQGKVKQVGSIAFIKEAAQTSRRSFKLNQWLLLLLRCLFLTVLALTLAGPVINKSKANANMGWVVVPKAYLHEVYGLYKKQIDSLLSKGYALHYLNKGLTEVSLEKALADSSKKAIKNTNYPDDFWGMVAQMNTLLPANTAVYIISPAYAVNFYGSKPGTALRIKWQTFTPADSASATISDAWYDAAGDVRVQIVSSGPSSNTVRVITAGANEENVKVSTRAGDTYVSLKTGGKQVKVNDSTRQFVVYQHGQAVDATYVTAALHTAAKFTGHKFAIKTLNDSTLIPKGCSWLFWLSNEQPSTAIRQKAAHVMYYAGNKTVSVNTHLLADNEYGVPGSLPVRLYKRTKALPANNAVWTDGYGDVLLDKQSTTYSFYTRFNPQWTDLVWDAQFPQLMLDLIFKPAVVTKFDDKRILPINQILPQRQATSHSARQAVKQTEVTDLSRYCWLLLIIILATERWLATQNQQSNG